MFIKEMLEKGAVGLLLSLDSIVYLLLGGAYRVFMAVAGARLLSSEAYTQVANKIYIIVGVLMLFVLSYSILRAIVDPDKNLKEELGGQLFKRVVIAVVGLAMAPMVFNLLYKAQALILDYNIIGNLFFNDEVLDDGQDPDTYVTQIGGYVTATSIWQAFFFPSEESGKKADEIKTDPSKYLVGAVAGFVGCAAAAAGAFLLPVAGIFLAGAAVASCISAAGSASNYEKYKDGGEMTLQDAYARTAAGDSFNIYLAFIDNYIDDGEITYFFIISTIAGGFALYAFISFSIDMGIRAAKMAYLQIVAPIPLIMQVVSSNKDIFKKYLDSVKDTFLQVFIRVSTVYIIIYIICHLTKLFGSTEQIWGNQELPTWVKVLALAILILGLIAFCRTAPKIIADTLGIKSEPAKLGLMDKLAAGGALGAAGILGAGATSMVQGFNKEKYDGSNKYAAFAKRMGNGARGLFGGMARAGWAQYGIGGKEAKTYGDVRGVASKAAQAEGDAIQNSVDRAERRRKAEEKERKAREDIVREKREVEEAIRRGDAAAQADHQRKLAEAQARAQQAHQEAMENTAAGNWLKERGKRIKVWASGTVDLTVEDTAIKVGTAMGTLQDKLRAEAAKKDAQSKALQAQMEDYQRQAQSISEYREGWNEQSYNEELQKRMQSHPEWTNLQTKQAALQTSRSARAKLDADLASGAITQAQFNTQAAALDSTIATQQSEVESASIALDAVRQSIVQDLDVVAKRSTAELTEIRADLQAKIDGAKKLMEARQDEWAQQMLAENNTEMLNIVNGELRQYLDFFDKHPNMEIPIEVDANGNVTNSIRVSELIDGNFGAGAMRGAVSGSSFQGESDITISFKPDASGHKPADLKFKFDSTTGTYKDVASGATLSPGEYAKRINAMLASIDDIKSNTASAVAKDKGKKARISIPTTAEYSRKNEIRRQQQESKK